MPSLMDILEDPNYVNANESTKQAIFDKYSALDDNFTKANDATQDAIRQKFGVSTPQEATTLESLGHGALRGALPAAAGIIGGAGAGALGAVAGPVGAIGAGLAGGFGASAAAAAAQEAFLQAHPDIAKSIGLSPEQTAKEEKAHPLAAFTGELAPNLLALRPSGALFKSAVGLSEDAAKKLAAEKIAAGVNASLGAGVGAGIQAGQEAMGEEPIDWQKVGIAGLMGATGQKETALGRGLAHIGEIPASAASKAAINALRRPGEVASSVTPEVTTQAETGVTPSVSLDTQSMLSELYPENKVPLQDPTAPIAAQEAPVEPTAVVPTVEPITPEAAKTPVTEPIEAPKMKDIFSFMGDNGEIKTVQGDVKNINGKDHVVYQDENGKKRQKVLNDKVIQNPTDDTLELLDLYHARDKIEKEPDDFRQWLNKVKVHSDEKSDLNYDKSLPHPYISDKGHGLDDLTLMAQENGLLSPEQLTEGVGGVESMREHINSALNGERVPTPNNIDQQAKYHAVDSRIQDLEAKLQNEKEFGLKSETPEESQARIDQEAASKKAQDDAAIKAEMDAQAARDKQAIAEQSKAQAENFQLGQTPEESLTGQQRLDEDIPFFERSSTPATDKFLEDGEALAKNLRSSLDKMGLSHVGLNLEDSIQAVVDGRMESVNGQYLKNMIHVSLASDDIPRTLNHEALHAMKDHGFFTDKDWSILSDKANKDWMQQYKIKDDYGHLPVELQHEEAIAKAFADYKTQTPNVKSIMAKAIEVLKRIGNVLRGRGFKNSEDIFKSAKEGKLSSTKDSTSISPMFEKQEKKPEVAKNIVSEMERYNQAKFAKEFPNVDLSSLPKTTAPSFEAPTVSHLTEFVRKTQDRYIDLKRTIEAIKKNGAKIAERFNPYEKLGLYHSEYANDARVFNENTLDPLAKKIDKLGLKTKEVSDYLHNRHAEERNNQMNKINPDIITETGDVIPYPLKDRASGIHTEDAKKYFKELTAQKKAALESVAKDFDKIKKDTQRILVESGQETQETIDQWNKAYEHYVPLERVQDEIQFPMSSSGKGLGLSGSFGKRAMGSEKEVTDIVNNIIGQHERALEIAQKMKVDHALYGLAIQSPNPEVWKAVNPDAIRNPELLARELNEMGLEGSSIVGLMKEPKQRVIDVDPVTGLDRVTFKTNPLKRYGDNVFPIRINGQDRFIFFNPKNQTSINMARSFRNMDTPTIGLAGQQIGKVTQWMAKVNTQWNPVFGGLNFLRDFGSAMANLSSTEIAGQQKKVAAGIQPAMAAVWRTMRSERSGAPLPDTEWAKTYQEFREFGGQTLYREQLKKRAEEGNILDDKIKDLHSNAAKKTASAFFNGLSDFNDSIENAIRLSAFKAAKDKGLSSEKAATIAKELTVNFDRKGAYGQMINNYFAFFNASVQGVSRMTQTLAGPAGKKLMIGGIGLGAMQAGMMALAGFGDDDPPEFVKSRNFIIPTPDGKYIAIPYPLGLHFLPNMGRIAVETGLHGDFTKHAGNMASVVADAFNPLGGGNLSLQTISPTVLDPVVALATNKDAFGRNISKQERPNEPSTGLSRTSERATAINKKVAEAINYVTGGTEDVKGFLSPTGDQLDYLVGQATGGAGREVMKVGKAATAISTGNTDQLASYDIPLAGRFYGDINSPAANSQHFYDNINKMGEYEATIKGMRQRKENVNEYMQSNPEARLWQQANNASNQIALLNKQKKAWEKAGRTDEQIRTLDDRKQAIMTRFNDKVKAFQD